MKSLFLRFTLRSLLLAMLLFAGMFAWLGGQWREYHRQKTAVESLALHGLPRPEWNYPWGSFWPVVVGLDSSGPMWEAGPPPKFDSNRIAQLLLLKDLKYLSLPSTYQLSTEFFRSLRHLNELEVLDLSHCIDLNDERLELLAEIPKLRELHISNTDVSTEAVERLRARRPGLEILDD